MSQQTNDCFVMIYMYVYNFYVPTSIVITITARRNTTCDCSHLYR